MNNKIIGLIFFSIIYFIDFTSCQTIEELIQSNRENLKNLYEMRGLPPEWVSTGNVTKEDLIKTLNNYDADVGMLIYTHQNDTLSTFLINREGKIVRNDKCIDEHTLIDEIEKANKWFSNLSLSRAPLKRGALSFSDYNIEEYREAYNNISKILLPFDIEELRQFKHLIIVPALNISIIPFAALKISSDEYLIDILSYSIAPSLYEIMVSNEMKESRAVYNSTKQYNFNNALFVANPAFPDDSLWNFPPLPGTEKEVDYITARFNNSNYLKLTGSEAKISEIIKHICHYDLLYFATHGISDEENPLENSYLVFAKDSVQSYFKARDIQSLRYNCLLNADLVVLSACQTGLGKSEKAGLIGLTRAFQIAGANNILMSLWSINDNETATLMGLFFDRLYEGGELMPHEALRKAILYYKKNINNNPNHWAPFSIFGIPY